MSHLENRVFSFHDVIMLMDYVGVGVGSTVHLIQQFDMEIKRDRERGIKVTRRWDFPNSLTEDQIRSLKELPVRNES